MCDCEDDYYEPEPPKRPEGCPRWLPALFAYWFTPVYDDWISLGIKKGESGIEMIMEYRDGYYKGGEFCERQFRYRPNITFAATIVPADIYA